MKAVIVPDWLKRYSLDGLVVLTVLIYKYEICSKSVDTETVFTKTKRNTVWNIGFLQNSPTLI